MARNALTARRPIVTVHRRNKEVSATELDPVQRVGFFRDVLGPLARTLPGGIAFIGNVDGVDLSRPKEAALGRPAFELRPSQ